MVLPDGRSTDLFDPEQKKDVKTFFESGNYEDSSAFIRIHRIDDTKDREIALIRGNVLENKPAWFIFQMTVEDFSEEKPKLKIEKLVAGFNGDTRFYPKREGKSKLTDEFSEYIARVTHTLGAWHRALST